LLEVDEWQVGQLQQQLAEEEKKGKSLLDQLHNMEAKLVICEKNREQLVAQLQNMSCELQVNAANELQVQEVFLLSL